MLVSKIGSSYSAAGKPLQYQWIVTGSIMAPLLRNTLSASRQTSMFSASLGFVSKMVDFSLPVMSQILENNYAASCSTYRQK